MTSTVTAGLKRSVCGVCGYVSISFQEEAVRIHQEASPPLVTPIEFEPEVLIDLTTQPRVKLPSCGECGSTARFYTPLGVACSYHAWEFASDQDVDIDEFWIPILIDRNAF
jgi:ribosomal protein S27AE